MQALERLQRALRVVHDRAFGDFQAQRVRVHRLAREQLFQLGRQVLVEQVACGQIDRELDLDALRAQLAPVAGALLDHPAGDHADEPRLLGKRNEAHRRHHAALRVLPAHERFGTNHAARGELHLGLQEQPQLVMVHRGAQLAQQRERFVARRVQRRVVHHHARLAGLGGIHRHLGPRKQPVGVVGMGWEGGHADAGAHVHRVIVERERCLQGLQHALRQGARGVGVGLRRADDEFVAAHVRHGVPSPKHAFGQAQRDLAQQPVAKSVAEHVVDVLEAVQVEHDHGARAVVAARLRQLLT